MSRPRTKPPPPAPPPPPRRPTHVQLPALAFQELVRRLEELPWRLADPILALVLQNARAVASDDAEPEPESEPEADPPSVLPPG